MCILCQFSVSKLHDSKQLSGYLNNSVADLQTADSLGVLTGNLSSSGSVSNTSPQKLFRFSLDAVSTFSAELLGLSADADLDLIQDRNNDGFLNGDGIDYGAFSEILDSSYNFGTDVERLRAVLSPGTYYIRVFQYQGDTNFDLKLSATPLATFSDTAGNSMIDARSLAPNLGSHQVDELVSRTDPLDYYRLTLDASSLIDVKLNGLTADADLRIIHDSNNNGIVDSNEVVAESTLFGVNAEEINRLALQAGVYFIEVSQFQGDTFYSLKINATPVEIPTDGAGNTLTTARNLGNLSGTQTIRDFVGDVDLEDVFQLNLDSVSNLSISLGDLNADVDLFLIQDINGNGGVERDEYLCVSTATGKAAEAIALTNLAAGTYFVQVKRFIGNTTYTLGLSVTSGTTDSQAVSVTDRVGDQLTVNPQNEIGVLAGKKSFSDRGGNPNREDISRFVIEIQSDFTAALRNLTTDADLVLIQDKNNNGVIDYGEELQTTAGLGVDAKEINANLAPGTYYLATRIYDTATSYRVDLSARYATGDLAIDSLLSGTRWNLPPNGKLTFSFVTPETAKTYRDFGGIEPVEDGVKSNIRNILSNVFSAVVPITFVEVSEMDNQVGDIRIMYDKIATYAYAFYPGSRIGGDVHLSPKYRGGTDSAFDQPPRSYGYSTLIHELGHSMGLKHPGNYNGNGQGDSPFLLIEEDNIANTVMSYHNDSTQPETLMPYDIRALQLLYGSNSAFNNTATFYQFNTLAIRETIWDGGGIDTLDFSALTVDAQGYVLDLRPGSSSRAVRDINGDVYKYYPERNNSNATEYKVDRYNLAIAFGTIIENIIGSSSNDTIYVNAAKNEVTGGGGNDVFVTGTGLGGATIDLADTVKDFTQGSDRIGLSSGLTFSGLTIQQGTDANVNNTYILVNGEYLLELVNIQASALTEADFVTV